MVKTNKKSLIAMIAMVVLLIASIAMGITGAWFTDQKDETGAEVTFGTVNISSSTVAVQVTKDDTVVMPGDTISISGKVINSGTAKIWVRYKLSHNYTSEGDLKNALDKAFTGAYTYVANAVEVSKAGISLDDELTIATSLGNTAQDATFSITLTVEAVQWANNYTGSCADAFKAAGYETTAVPVRG